MSYSQKAKRRPARQRIAETRENRELSTSILPLNTAPRQALYLTACCEKHSEIFRLELKRIYNVKRLCDVHLLIKGASPGAIIEKLQRMHGGIFRYQPIPASGLKSCEFSLSLESDHE